MTRPKKKTRGTLERVFLVLGAAGLGIFGTGLVSALLDAGSLPLIVYCAGVFICLTTIVLLLSTTPSNV